jgi:hypothetical protein
MRKWQSSFWTTPTPSLSHWLEDYHPKYERSILRWLCMRRDPLRVLGGARRNDQLSLPGLSDGERQRLSGNGADGFGLGSLGSTTPCRASYGRRQPEHSKARVCSQCGTPLFASSLARPEFIGVKVSSFDDPSWFAPEADVWMASAQPWDFMDPSVSKFNKNRSRQR